MHTLDGGRIGIAAQALGLAEGALDRTVAYTKERKQFGRSIAQQQNTQFQLADMATRGRSCSDAGLQSCYRLKHTTEGILCRSC